MAANTFGLARQVLRQFSMDFALIAPALPSTTPTLAADTAIAPPNDQWLMSWLEIAPGIIFKSETETASDLDPHSVATMALPIRDWILGIQPVEREALISAEILETANQVEIQENVEEVAADDEEGDDSSGSDAQELRIVASTPQWSTQLTQSGPQAPLTGFARAPGKDSPKSRSAPEAPTGPPLAGDKGELIWQAELVLTAPPQSQSEELENETLRPSIKTAVSPASVAETASRSELRDSQQQQEESERQPDSGIPDTKRKAAPAGAVKHDDSRVIEPEHIGAKDIAVGEPRTAQALSSNIAQRTSPEHFAEFKAEMAETSAPIEATALAQRPRPSQVARVQVEIENPGHAQETLRLVLTQRGGNVSVQLRSWNESVAPLRANEVQPLLDNLAQQGLTPASDGTSNTITAVEPAKEHEFVSGQFAANLQDDRGSQGFDERQQRQQERHNQQQENLLRRSRLTRSDFDLQSSLDETHTR